MRLWVRLSLMISGLLLAVIVTTAVIALFFYEQAAGQSGGVPINPGQFGPSSIGGAYWRVAGFIAFVGLIGVTVGVVVSRTVSAPISRLAAAAHSIGAGDLNSRVRVSGSQELVELAAAFNKMAADLQHAEELRANLIADVSHELRTPLTVLEGNLRAALDHIYVLDEAMIADLYGQARHLIHLVNDLRELALADARQLPLHKEPTDLTVLVDEALRMFAPLAEDQGIQLLEQIPVFPTIVVDAGRVRQVLHNLLANALRYTPEGGSVTVLGRFTPDTIVLAVKDTGVGLSTEQTLHVFDRFYRGDASRSRDTGGAGLGLAIAKAIIEAHDGRVTVTSGGLDQGSTFSIYLPRQLRDA